ncbi:MULTISPECIES: hypothetical protein [unclassified Corallococcus]|uniref:hypothetical protein n=1 Tax=unclassified Corallococcus TaxID=2685029 RepID=UPI001A8F7260|nr:MULTISPECIES: hypothetical protein [unclassified Corallococcus]MBN9682646.1 hypothetical protein [Corallococcus sp. NCSPR001]WAS85809.1 hypothetical protein O0N60_02280 [Corallococcus sp. NCRR]
MFLASLLSVFAGAWMFAAAPFTVTMKSAGYSAHSDGETVTVTQVEPKSVAAEAGLQPGMKVKRIDMPARAFIKVPLPQLDATDLQDALTPQPGESLWLKVDPHPKGTTQVVLKSREPLPDKPFPNVPLTQAQLERLTPMQFAMYHARLQQAFMEEQERPRLDARQDTTAYVMKGKLVGVEGGGATPRWLHPSIDLTASCLTGVESVELVSTAKGVGRTLRPEDSRYPGTKTFDLTPALWSVPQVLQQCEGTPRPLEQSVRIKLTCKGKPPLEQEVAMKLAVRCDVPAPGNRQPLSLREPWDFMVGDKTPLQVDVSAHQLIPRPTEATLVEVDAEGRVTRRLKSLPMGKNAHESSLQVEVPLDTTVARTVRLALEARYSDGSTWLSEPQTREIRSQAQREVDEREVMEAHAKMEAFQKRLAARFNDPCADLPATMKWMDAQPDLEYASAEEDGHSFSYKVKGALAPLIFICHRHR